MTEDQIEAARTKVRNMLHAADHGNHLGEMAVLRMAASGELEGALKACRSTFEEYALLHYRKHTADGDEKAAANQRMATLCDDALSLAQPYEAEVER